MTSTTDIRATVESRLLAGEAPKAIAADLGLDCYGTPDTDDDDTVVLPRWHADDGNCEVELDVATGDEAAREYVDGGDWGEGNGTWWCHVTVWRVALRAVDGEIVDERVDECPHRVTVNPVEPEYSSDEHDWRSPHKLVGGLRENPGVWGNGGGVKIHEICRNCGTHRHTDTWAQDPYNGQQGLTSVSYTDADEESAAWAAEQVAADRPKVTATVRTVECSDTTITVQLEIPAARDGGSPAVFSRTYQWDADNGWTRDDGDHDQLDDTDASLALDEQASYGAAGATRTVELADASPA